MAVNYAARYDKAVDEKFSAESQAALVTNHNYTFTGCRTVNVYSVGTATMSNYTASGSNRYGSPQELQNTVQELTVTQDRSCSFTIDKKSRVQTPGVMDSGKALGRQLREVVIPEYDAYVFRKMALAAQANGSKDTTVPNLTTDANKPYKLFLAAQAYLAILKRHEEIIKEKLVATEKRHEIALSFLESVDIASAFGAKAISDMTDFESLLELKLPDIALFDDVAMKAEFDAITQKLMKE